MEIKYSLDMLTIDMKLSTVATQNIIDVLMSANYNGCWGECNYWISPVISKFKYNYSFTVSRGEHYFFGIQPNWMPPSSYNTYVRLEFNPSKLFACEEFFDLHRRLVAGALYVDVKKFDVAIDIPSAREDVFLLKDQRKRTTYELSESNKTTYLGQRGNHGNVKLYNKQLEAKLTKPLTRLEITMDYEKISDLDFQAVFPRVLVFDTGQLVLDDESYNGTDRVLMLACLEHSEYLDILPRVKRKKIECILSKYTHMLEPDLIKYKQILSQVLMYCKPLDIFSGI